jgi:hypothetical protein
VGHHGTFAKDPLALVHACVHPFLKPALVGVGEACGGIDHDAHDNRFSVGPSILPDLHAGRRRDGNQRVIAGPFQG